MPCIGILGCSVSEEDLPEMVSKMIFDNNVKLSTTYHNPKRRIQRANSPLNIYSIEYNGIEIDVYKDSYEDYLKDRIYFVYEIAKPNSCGIEMPFLLHDDFGAWVSDLQKLFFIKDIGFFLVEN